MKYEHTEIRGLKAYCAEICTSTNKENIREVLVSETKQELRQEVKSVIKERLKKNKNVLWNRNTRHQVSMYRVTEYDTVENEDSEFVTRYTITTVDNTNAKKTIEHSMSRARNSSYAGNPECEFCYKKTTRLHRASRLDAKKTERMVCGKCKKRLGEMRKIWKSIQSKD